MSGVRIPSLTPFIQLDDLHFWLEAEPSLTAWLGFRLGHQCDVNHMESCGVWCSMVLRSVQGFTHASGQEMTRPPNHASVKPRGRCWWPRACPRKNRCRLRRQE